MAVLVATAACGGDDIELYPITPGGGGGGGIAQPDAGIDADVGGSVSGRVCAISDARKPQDCASGAAGVTVKIGSQMATTAADGTFSISRDAGATLWQVSGTGYVSSAMTFASGTNIPLLEQTVYDTMLDTNSAISGGNTGAIIMNVRHLGSPVNGAEGSATPAPGGATYYDASTYDVWETDTTAAAGVIWIPGLTAGMESVEVTSNGTKTFPGILVIADTITWVFANV